MKAIIQVPMEKDLLERLDRQAKSKEIPRAALIRRACLLYLRELEREELEREYEEGYRRIPDETTEEESDAWLKAALLPEDRW